MVVTGWFILTVWPLGLLIGFGGGDAFGPGVAVVSDNSDNRDTGVCVGFGEVPDNCDNRDTFGGVEDVSDNGDNRDTCGCGGGVPDNCDNRGTPGVTGIWLAETGNCGTSAFTVGVTFGSSRIGVDLGRMCERLRLTWLPCSVSIIYERSLYRCMIFVAYQFFVSGCWT